MGVHDWRDILSRWLRSVCIWQGRFFRVITPCRSIHESFAAPVRSTRGMRLIYFRRRWKLATTYGRSFLPSSSSRSCSGASARVKRDLSKRASRSIFLRSFIHRPCTRGRAPRRKFVVAPKTKSERPEAP